MRSPKKAPPDTEGNVAGRILQLRQQAKQTARVEARDGGDYLRALGRQTKALEPELAKLKKRLSKAKGSARRARAAEDAEPAEEGGDDLLATLGALNRRRQGS